MEAPTEKKTQEEIQRFLQMNEADFDKFSTPKSFNSNIKIAGKNFLYLVGYLKQTLAFLKNLYLILDPAVLAQDVLEAIATSKPKIDILASQLVDSERTQTFGTVNPKIYKIYRATDYKVVITLDNSVGNVWKVDGLIVQVKSAVDGQIIYPNICTINDSMEVTFHDKISKNYFLLFI